MTFICFSRLMLEGKMKISERLMLDEISFKDKKVKLSKPLEVNIDIEEGIRYDIYILSNEELKLLAIQKSLNDASIEIQEEFYELWEEYVDCPENELTIGAIDFKKKLMSYIEDTREKNK